MKFCSFCDNMMYIKVNDARKLLYFCKNCNYNQEEDTSSSICILDNNNIDEETNYTQYVTKHLKHDMTLPRVTNIDCPNEDCTRASGAPQDIIYVKYDFANMRYLYHCVHCDHFWRS